MLTEEQLEILGDQIAPLYQQLEQDVIADIARRVKKTGRYTETAELMAQAMAAKGASPAKIRVEVMRILRADKAYQDQVAKNTLEYKKEVVKEIKAAELEAKRIGDEIIAQAGDMSYNGDLSMWQQAGKKLTKNSAFTVLVEEMSSATNGSLKNITQTTGFKGAHGMVSVKNAYTNALDKAVLKMCTGTFSFDQAVVDCVKELAQSGLRSIDYASGKSYQLDTAARMCIRTAAHQLSAKISMKHCEDMGTDLVEVSSHWGARPEHALWQGKIYSRSGKNRKYPKFAVCRYGAVDGLCGINCRHIFYPFFEGISEPNKWESEPTPKNYNGKMFTYYQATQKQRQMERNVRDTKREIEAGKVLGVDVSVLEAKKRRQITEYHRFSRAMNIREKDNRLRVVSGSSELNKTKTKRYFNSLVKSGSDDIMKSKSKEKIIGNDSFRITKSKFLNAEYEDISALKHSLSNLDVRIWYKAKDINIENIIDKSKPLEEQARQAFELRNTYRTQARELMRDQSVREQLDKEHPNKDFDSMLADKMKRKGITHEEALKDIINTSGKTNKKVNKSLGLEE